MPIVFGTADVAGNVMWIDKIVEHRNSGGKSGGDTFSYTQSIAIGLCERVDDTAADTIGAIAGITRIWENGAIVFDIRPQQAANTLLNTLAETDVAYAHRLAASAQYAATFVLHLGDETQAPDPTIESVEGAGNVPAFRGLAYIVYPNRALKLVQGQRHPNFTFEVYTLGAGACVDAPFLSPGILHPWAGSTADPTHPGNVNTFQIVYADGNHLPSYPNTQFNTLGDALAIGIDGYRKELVYLGYASDIFAPGASLPSTGIQQDTYGPATPVHIPVQSVPGFTPMGGQSPDPMSIVLHYNIQQPNSYGRVDKNPVIDNVYHHDLGADVGRMTKAQKVIPFVSPPAPWLPLEPGWGQQYLQGGDVEPYPGFTYLVESVYDFAIKVTRAPGPPVNPCTGLPQSIENPGYCFDATTQTFIKDLPWVYTVDGADPLKYASLNYYYPSTSQANPYPNEPTVERSQPMYPGNAGATSAAQQAFWEAAYATAVAAGTMPAGLSYAPSGGGGYPIFHAAAYRVNRVECTGVGAYAHIDAIITAICKRSGMLASEIDVSDLGVPTIPGYAISSLSNGANIISPLRTVAFFDAVESGPVLKFPKRGRSIATTLTIDQFGCYDSGAAGAAAPGPAITSVRVDETTLPRSIRLHYKALSRDYQPGDAQSPFRLTTSAINDQDVSLPMVLEDHQAMKVAEILWTDAWAGKISHDLSVDQSMWALEPSDCILVPVDGVLQRLRITHDKNASGVLRTLSCARDSEDSYVSIAVAPAPGFRSRMLNLIGKTQFEILDLPALHDWDSDAGLYLAAQATQSYDWAGAQIYKSPDGATFTQLPSMGAESTVGTITGAIPVSSPASFDDTTVIEVVLDPAYSFFSVPDASLDAGANTLAVGAPRRWELIQFGTATKVDPTHWHLTHLLRGRRGTEYLIGTSIGGDTAVLVADSAMLRVPLDISERGQVRTYRAVSRGLTPADAVDHTYAGNAQALVPFAPVDLAAVFSTQGDWELSWRRRDRLGVTGIMNPPLSEAYERYEIDVYSDATFLNRTATISGAPYINAPYANVNGSSSGIFWEVFQMSAAVGRGIGARSTQYAGRGGPAITTTPGLPIDSARSAHLLYTHFAKSGYPGWSVAGSGVEATILEWRFRFPASFYVVDIQGEMQYVGSSFDPNTNSLAYGNSIIARFDDGSGSYVARTNANHLVWADKDPTETRYLYVARLYGGAGYSGPGIIQKIDTQAIVHSPVHELNIVASVSVGTSGDPHQVLQLGTNVWTFNNYDQSLECYSASTLTLQRRIVLGQGSVPYVSFIMRGPGPSLWAFTQTSAERASGVHSVSQLDQITGAILSTFPVSSDTMLSPTWEGVIVGTYLYGFFIHTGASPSFIVRKFNIGTGATEAFAQSITCTGSSLFNYIQVDGSIISVGRYPNIYTINTATDVMTSWAPPPSISVGGDLVTPVSYTAGEINFSNYSILVRVAASDLLGSATTWKFYLNVISGSVDIGACNVRTTDAGDNASGASFTSSTAVTWGGNAAPTLAAGRTLCDAIAVAIDGTKDIYLEFYFGSSANNNAVSLASLVGGYPITGGYRAGNNVGGTTIWMTLTGNKSLLVDELIKAS